MSPLARGRNALFRKPRASRGRSSPRETRPAFRMAQSGLRMFGPGLGLLQNDALEKVSRGFREYSASQSSLAILFGVILGLGIVAALVYAWASGRDRVVGRRMFLKLARASGLARPESELLIRIARRVLPDNPPAIFVRRSLFENAVADLEPDEGLVQAVRRKVYGA